MNSVFIYARSFLGIPTDWNFAIGAPTGLIHESGPFPRQVASDRAQLSEIVQRVRDGRLRTNIGNLSTLDDAVAALNPTERRRGKTIIRVRP